MKKFLLFICLILFQSTTFANVEQIHYGYNAKGEYVPIGIGNKTINYGYNSNGDYDPTSITNSKDYRDTTNIEYGYNAKGEYVPVRMNNPY